MCEHSRRATVEVMEMICFILSRKPGICGVVKSEMEHTDGLITIMASLSGAVPF